MKSRLCYFILACLLCGCTASRHKANGWYRVADFPDNTIIGEAIVTTDAFEYVTLDSIKDDCTTFIEGQLKQDRIPLWADVTERCMGHRIGFVFNDSVVMAPKVNCRMESGRFTINSNDKNLILEIYDSIVRTKK